MTATNLLAWIQAGSGLLLMVITAIYVVLTYKVAKATQASASAAIQAADAATANSRASELTADETVLQRRALSEPFPVLERANFDWYGRSVSGVDVSITNIGGGPCFGLSVYMFFESASSQNKSTMRPALATGKSEVLRIDFASSLQWESLSSSACYMECLDAFGNTHWWNVPVQVDVEKRMLIVSGPPLKMANKPAVVPS